MDHKIIKIVPLKCKTSKLQPNHFPGQRVAQPGCFPSIRLLRITGEEHDDGRMCVGFNQEVITKMGSEAMKALKKYRFDSG